MYVDKLEIENFRCFEHTEFKLVHPDRTDWDEAGEPALKNVNLFLGDNGSGKSSVFKAVAIGVLTPIIVHGVQAEYFIRRTSSQSAGARDNEIGAIEKATIRTDVRLDFIDRGASIRSTEAVGIADVRRTGDVEYIDFTHNYPESWGTIYLNNYPAFFVVGYGANRRMERPEGYSENTRLPRYQRVAGLFESHVGLVPFTYAYLQIKDRGYLQQVIALINDLLPEDLRLTETSDNQNRPLFSWREIELPFDALSDGYRTYIAWLWDMLYQMVTVMNGIIPDDALTNLPGVCIVDEIDLFLHPEWQRLVVKQVAEAFPKIQFLFSTHSPIVAGTLHPANIFVLDDNKVEQYRENIYGLTPNQILTSSYFGLSSTRAPGTGTLSDQARRKLGIDDSDTDPLAAAAVRETVQRLIANGVISTQVPNGPKKPSRRKSTAE